MTWESILKSPSQVASALLVALLVGGSTIGGVSGVVSGRMVSMSQVERHAEIDERVAVVLAANEEVNALKDQAREDRILRQLAETEVRLTNSLASMKQAEHDRVYRYEVSELLDRLETWMRDQFEGLGVQFRERIPHLPSRPPE